MPSRTSLKRGRLLISGQTLAMVDTEDTELFAIQNTNWTACGLNKEAMHSAFALHDNDYGSHVYLPYLASLIIGPFGGFALSIMYESSAILEKIYGVKVLHSSASFTGIVDGLLQDPLAGFVGAALVIVHVSIHGRTIVSIRDEWASGYGNVGFKLNMDSLGFAVFFILPLAVGHNFGEWVGLSVTSGILHVWTMMLSGIVPVIYTWLRGALHTLGNGLLLETWAVVACAQVISYIGLKTEAPDPVQSTPFWTLLLCTVHVIVMARTIHPDQTRHELLQAGKPKLAMLY